MWALCLYHWRRASGCLTTSILLLLRPTCAIYAVWTATVRGTTAVVSFSGTWTLDRHHARQSSSLLCSCSSWMTLQMCRDCSRWMWVALYGWKWRIFTGVTLCRTWRCLSCWKPGASCGGCPIWRLCRLGWWKSFKRWNCYSPCFPYHLPSPSHLFVHHATHQDPRFSTYSSGFKNLLMWSWTSAILSTRDKIITQTYRWMSSVSIMTVLVNVIILIGVIKKVVLEIY